MSSDQIIDAHESELRERSDIRRAMITVHALNESIVLWQGRCESLTRLNRTLMSRLSASDEVVNELQLKVQAITEQVQAIEEGDKIADNVLAAKDHEIKQLREQIGEWESRYEAAVTCNGDHHVVKVEGEGKSGGVVPVERLHAASNRVSALSAILTTVGGVARAMLEKEKNKKSDYAGGRTAACGDILHHIPWPYDPAKDRPERAPDYGPQETTQEAQTDNQSRQTAGA